MKNITAILTLASCLACAMNLQAQAEQASKKQQTTKKLQSPKQAAASQPNAPAIPKGGKAQPMIKPAVNAEGKIPALVVPPTRVVFPAAVVVRSPVVLSPFVVGVRTKWMIVDDPTFIAQDPNIQAEAELLREAYILMSRANADYDGHRIRAMRQTAEAARHLGMTLRGDEPGDEDQSVSDSQLRVARELLNQAQAGLSAKGRPYATQDVGNAIHQIDTALGIR